MKTFTRRGSDGAHSDEDRFLGLTKQDIEQMLGVHVCLEDYGSNPAAPDLNRRSKTRSSTIGFWMYHSKTAQLQYYVALKIDDALHAT